MFGHEHPRIAVGAQPRPRLMPDQVTLGDEPDGRGARRKVGADELVAPVLVGVADDDDRVATDPQDAIQLDEDRLHPIEERGVVGGIGEIGRGVADHRVVGPPVGVGLGQHAARHGARQLDVVRRIGRDEVDGAVGQCRQDGQGVTQAEVQARRVERTRPAGVGRAQVRDPRPRAVVLGEQPGDHLMVDRDPARIQLDADGAPRSTRDGRPQQCAADAGERVQDEVAGLAEELDQAGHESRRLVGAVGLAGHMSQLRRVRRGQHGLREIQPFLARQVVEVVGGMGGAAAVGHRRQRSRVGRGRWSWVTAPMAHP